MSAFEVVIIVVAVVGIGLALTPRFGLGRALSRLGRGGGLWFEHTDERELAERPTGDERDAPLPRRPLRGRPR
jgi:hypothetical protein